MLTLLVLGEYFEGLMLYGYYETFKVHLMISKDIHHEVHVHDWQKFTIVKLKHELYLPQK